MSAEAQPVTTVRLDKWLWLARFCKTRALAQKLIGRGQITLNGATIRKPSASVRLGDALVATLGPVKRTVAVKALGTRRGSASEAKDLFDEPTPPQRLDRDERGVLLHRPLLVRPKGSGRPTKKQRREIDKFFER
ncbi:MAG: RNA-binding S4 domain-containing protein [Rhodospirillaceae bacterium]|nr:RNA-binding S4 domain-containing protein [Rhodospirillaceae bacterium]